MRRILACYKKMLMLTLCISIFNILTVLSRTPFLPKGKVLESFVIADPYIPSSEDWVTMVTLQGLVAKQSSEQIYFGGSNSKTEFSNTLKDIYALPVTAQITVRWDLLIRYKSFYSGYILYKGASERNQATSLCGILNGVAVEESKEAQFRSKTGVTNVLADVRGKSELDIWNEYKNQFNHDFAAELDNDLFYHLRDYCVMSNMFVFTPNYNNPTFKTQVLRSLSDTGGLFGYAQVVNGDEYGAFTLTNTEGIFPLGTNMVGNLSIMSSLKDDQLTIKRKTSVLNEEDDVHYVTFMMSDGDNLAYNMWSQVDIWNSTVRGQFPVGWGMMPSSQELAPAVLNFFYKNASDNDHFFAQGGVGGIYPSKWPIDRLAKHVEQVNTYMGIADMRVLQFIDQNSAWSTSSYWKPGAMWDLYTSKPNIKGIFFYSYGGGPGAGDVKFLNGKPIVMLRDFLWGGLCDENQLTTILNNRMSDPYTKEGYTAICVHVWTKGLDNIKQVVDKLNPKIRIVSPEEFMERVKQNVALKTGGAFVGNTPMIPAIIQAESYDFGGEKVAYHISQRSSLPNNEIRNGDYVNIIKENNDYWVSDLKAGEFLRYTVIAQNTRNYYLSLQVKSEMGATILVDINGDYSSDNVISVPANTNSPVKLSFPKSISLSSRNDQTIRVRVVEGKVSLNNLDFTIDKPNGLVGTQINSDDIQYYTRNDGKIIINIKDENNEITSVELFDSSGRKVSIINGEVKKNNYILDSNKFLAGIYFLAVNTINNRITKKIILG